MGQACSSCNCNQEENATEVVTLGGNKKPRGKGYEVGNANTEGQTANTNDCDDSDGEPLEWKEEHKFTNGAVYKGYWKNGMRHGEGTQIWPDGARYEGFWRKNKAHGKGKFWHVDGDVFEGEWKDDKANGYGVYTHVNGAKYEGYWKDDL